MSARVHIHVGTSGWNYDNWKGVFYPGDLPSGQYLVHYADRFRTVEVNNTFYGLPERRTLVNWRDSVADDFVFSVKASRYITHMKKLKDPEEPVATFIETVEVLGDKLGPILFQLPPNWNFNEERLRSFLEVLPAGFRYTFELRDPSWLNEAAYAALAEHDAAFCIYDFDGRLSPKEVTTDFVYVRLHGPDEPYTGAYDTETLAGWAGAFSTWADQGKEIFCYFDNTDGAGYAPHDALQLREMLR